MSFINRIRKMFPAKKVNVNELEHRILLKTQANNIYTVHEAYNEKLINENDDTTDLKYHVIEWELLPETIACLKCQALTIEGLDYCDSCGQEINN